jgi:hypothetical protein
MEKGTARIFEMNLPMRGGHALTTFEVTPTSGRLIEVETTSPDDNRHQVLSRPNEWRHTVSDMSHDSLNKTSDSPDESLPHGSSRRSNQVRMRSKWPAGHPQDELRR